MRLLAMWAMGGMYVDIDVIVLRDWRACLCLLLSGRCAALRGAIGGRVISDCHFRKRVLNMIVILV